MTRISSDDIRTLDPFKIARRTLACENDWRWDSVSAMLVKIVRLS